MSLASILREAMRHQDEPSGKRGVWNIGDLKLRCFVDPATECWIWKGAIEGGRGRTGLACMGGKVVNLGYAVCVLVIGAAPPKGTLWLPVKCNDRLCCNPLHRAPMPRGTERLGAENNAVHRWKIAIAKRAVSKITDEQVQEAINRPEPASEIAPEYGISAAYLRMLRRGQWRRPLWSTRLAP